MKKVNWGIIGLGKISHKFAHDLKYVKNGKLIAVASRDLQKAEEFSKQYGAIKAYGDYEMLAKDPDVDVVYIATPHTMHCENTLMCLENKKAVLCEKPFAMNSQEVEKMVSLAREKELFLMEALWTRFLPHIAKVIEICSNGMIGTPKLLVADFGFKAPYNPEQRLFNTDLGGGSLLDIGIYPLFLSLLLFGMPDEIKAQATFNKTGADETCSVLLKYRNGQQAVLYSTLMENSPVEAYIYGSLGKLHLLPRWFSPANLDLNIDDQKRVSFKYKTKGYGYQFEALEVGKCILNRKTESLLMPLAFSVNLMELLDAVRKEAGIVYRADLFQK